MKNKIVFLLTVEGGKYLLEKQIQVDYPFPDKLYEIIDEFNSLRDLLDYLDSNNIEKGKHD